MEYDPTKVAVAIYDYFEIIHREGDIKENLESDKSGIISHIEVILQGTCDAGALQQAQNQLEGLLKVIETGQKQVIKE